MCTNTNMLDICHIRKPTDFRLNALCQSVSTLRLSKKLKVDDLSDYLWFNI